MMYVQTCKVEVVQSEQPEVLEKDEILLSSSSTLRAARVSLCGQKSSNAILKVCATWCATWSHLVCQDGALGLIGD